MYIKKKEVQMILVKFELTKIKNSNISLYFMP